MPNFNSLGDEKNKNIKHEQMTSKSEELIIKPEEVTIKPEMIKAEDEEILLLLAILFDFKNEKNRTILSYLLLAQFFVTLS